MRRFLPINLLLVGLSGAGTAAAEAPGEIYGTRTAANSVYVEGLGLGLVYSVNYDRTVTDDFAARVGLGLILGDETSSTGKSSFEPILVSVPITLSYIGAGSRWTMLEVGAGFMVLHAGANVKTIYVERRDSALTSIIATGIVGFRYQPPKGGLQLRGGVSALVGRYGFLPLWPYFSVGYSF